MDETNTTWKNHSFTLLIFGGIVALCFIFFVLGMLVGRNQGQRLAEIAAAEEAASKPVADTAEDFPLEFYSQTTEEKPAVKLQPVPETPASTAVTPPAPETRSAEKATATVKPQPVEAKATAEKSTATAKLSAPRTSAKSPAVREVFLQVTANKNEKQASQELKRVESKGFNGKILTGKTSRGQIHRVVVGPYKESEINLVKSDLAAKGYKGAFVTK
jgi:cell division septation protein DedD